MICLQRRVSEAVLSMLDKFLDLSILFQLVIYYSLYNRYIYSKCKDVVQTILKIIQIIIKTSGQNDNAM